jgi:hypothetical protein
MSTLQQEPPLPLTKKQRLMIGEERAAEAVRAQLAGRGLHEMPLSAGGPSSLLPYMQMHQLMLQDALLIV